MTTAEFIIDFAIACILIINLFILWTLGQQLQWLEQGTTFALERIRERLRELEGRP
jgi:hypothetical protein